MAKRKTAAIGPIVDDAIYIHSQLAEILGKSERAIKDFIRSNVTYAEPMEGMLVVSGFDFRLAIERLSDFDTPEKKELRMRKSGAATRRARASGRMANQSSTSRISAQADMK